MTTIQKQLCILLTLILTSCKLPTVGYFNTQPFIKAHKIDVDKDLTIVLDANIPDSLVIKSAGVKKMIVKQYRETLEDALKNTFKSTYNSLNVSYTFDQKGISLVLIKATPVWNKKSAQTIVSGQYGTVSSQTKYEHQCQVLYQAIVYSDGERIGVIEGTSFSEKTTFKRRETREVFEDGIKILCEDLYKQLITFK